MSARETLTLYGLRIIVVDREDVLRPDGCDVLWLRLRVDKLPPSGAPNVSVCERSDGLWTHHAFGDARGIGSEFDVSPDGTIVISRSLPLVPAHDVLSLFAEPVMRSIFKRRGLFSLHGVALHRGSDCIVLIGRRGAGKSTFAAALVSHGWSLLTDDLSRLRQDDDVWSVPSGFRQLKLRKDVVDVLGYDPKTLDRRWQNLEAPDDVETNKYVIHITGDTSIEARLSVVYLMDRRTDGARTLHVQRLSPVDQVRNLAENMSSDPADPRAPPSQAEISAVGAILRNVGFYRLGVPGNIGYAIDAARDLPTRPS